MSANLSKFCLKSVKLENYSSEIPCPKFGGARGGEGIDVSGVICVKTNGSLVCTAHEIPHAVKNK